VTKLGFRFFLFGFLYICYGCLFAFIVFILVFQYLAKRLAGKTIFEMTYFVSGVKP